LERSLKKARRLGRAKGGREERENLAPARGDVQWPAHVVPGQKKRAAEAAL
jgi:hypothetical protein